MATKNILTHPAQSGQNPILTHQQKSASECRFEIQKMTDQYGSVLNNWPEPCRREYERLSRMLRWLESDHVS